MTGDLYETILHIPESELSISYQAIIVPAYEVRFDSEKIAFMSNTRGMMRRMPPECNDLKKCWSKHLFLIPHHKDELLSCLNYGPCKQFKAKIGTHVVDWQRIHF